MTLSVPVRHAPGRVPDRGVHLAGHVLQRLHPHHDHPLRQRPGGFRPGTIIYGDETAGVDNDSRGRASNLADRMFNSFVATQRWQKNNKLFHRQSNTTLKIN